MKLKLLIYSNWASCFTFDFCNYKILKIDPDEFLKNNIVFEILGAIYFISNNHNKVRIENKIKNV